MNTNAAALPLHPLRHLKSGDQVVAPGSGMITAIEFDEGQYRITFKEERQYFIEGEARQGEWEILIDGLSSVSGGLGAVSAGSPLGRAGPSLTAVARSLILDPWLVRHSTRTRYLDGLWWFAAEWITEQPFDPLSYRQSGTFFNEAAAVIEGEMPQIPGSPESRVPRASQPTRVMLALPDLPTQRDLPGAGSSLQPGIERFVSVGMIGGFELLLGFDKSDADQFGELYVPGDPVYIYGEPVLILLEPQILITRVDHYTFVSDEQIIQDRLDQLESTR